MDIYRHPYPPDMPMGLDMALSRNRGAMDYFYSLPEAEKQRIMNHTHLIRSKEEMQAYVDSLVK